MMIPFKKMANSRSVIIMNRSSSSVPAQPLYCASLTSKPVAAKECYDMVVVVAKQIPQASVNIIVDHKNTLESRVGLAFRPLFIPLPQVAGGPCRFPLFRIG